LELDRDGLVWCFEAAARMVDPEAPYFSDEARPPRRLLIGRTFQPIAGDENGRGLTPDELEKALERDNTSWWSYGDLAKALKVLYTDEEEAVDFVRLQLARVLQGFANSSVLSSINSIGVMSPTSYWKALEDFAGHDGDEERREVAVAFEQLGAESALKVVKAAYKKEKDSRIKQAWVRALAASGPKNNATRRTILGIATEEDSIAMRASAAFAMGYLQRSEDVREVWYQLLADPSLDLRVAAACGIALARDEECIPAIEAALKAFPNQQSGDNKATLERVLVILLGGTLSTIQSDVERVTGDYTRRERVFFGPPIDLPGADLDEDSEVD
jgi:hypothetical protein